MILSQEDKKFIQDNIKEDISKLALKTHKTNSSMGFLLTQIQSRQKAVKKLPTWVQNPDVLFYSKLSTEQCSSELTAEYKANLIVGNSLLDLCSGFGVDDVFFSKKVKELTALEMNSDLVDVVRHNHKMMDLDNVTLICAEAEQFLSESTKRFDWLYVDPARRDDSNRKLVSFQDCSPDVLTLDLFQYADNLLVKASPMLEIRKGMDELSGVKEVHVVAVKNELKELLFLCQKGYEGEVKCICADLQKHEYIAANFNGTKEVGEYSVPQDYLFEPNVAIMKAHLFNVLIEKYGLYKLHPNTNFFTANDYDNQFEGRIFKQIKTCAYKPKEIKKLGIKQANVIARNFFITPEEFKKKFKIKDGGHDYLLLCTDSEGQQIVVLCKRIK